MAGMRHFLLIFAVVALVGCAGVSKPDEQAMGNLAKQSLAMKKFIKGKRITFHDPCYLGRANTVYEAPREVLAKTNAELVEMKRHKTTALCCGAGGGQMFKEPEKGDMDINVLRTKDALETNPNIIATGCPYCNTMMTDGIKAHEKEDSFTVLDVAELLANSI